MFQPNFVTFTSTDIIGNDPMGGDFKGNQNNGFTFVMFKDGSGGVEKEMKNWVGNKTGRLYLAEILAAQEYLAARVGEAMNAPIRDCFMVGPDAKTVIMPYIDGESGAELDLEDNYPDTAQGWNLRLFDFFVANSDRRPKNLMYVAGGRIVGIDHALCNFRPRNIIVDQVTDWWNHGLTAEALRILKPKFALLEDAFTEIGMADKHYNLMGNLESLTWAIEQLEAHATIQKGGPGSGPDAGHEFEGNQYAERDFRVPMQERNNGIRRGSVKGLDITDQDLINAEHGAVSTKAVGWSVVHRTPDGQVMPVFLHVEPRFSVPSMASEYGIRHYGLGTQVISKEKIGREDLFKGGPGSGAPDGHEFEGNQWTNGESFSSATQPKKWANHVVTQLNGGKEPNIHPGELGLLLHEVSKDNSTGNAVADASNIQINGTHLLGQDGLGYKRSEMPQVPQKMRSQFFADMQAQGFTMTRELVDPTTLQPSQSEIGLFRAAELYERNDGVIPQDKALLVSKDNYVIDGHHNWVAAVATHFDHPDQMLPVIRIGSDAHTIITHALSWTAQYGIKPKVMGKSLLVKGGPGSGAQPGHAFEGNQWTGDEGLRVSARNLASEAHDAYYRKDFRACAEAHRAMAAIYKDKLSAISRKVKIYAKDPSKQSQYGHLLDQKNAYRDAYKNNQLAALFHDNESHRAPTEPQYASTHSDWGNGVATKIYTPDQASEVAAQSVEHAVKVSGNTPAYIGKRRAIDLVAAVVKSVIAIAKGGPGSGPQAGHEFEGNQWTGGEGVSHATMQHARQVAGYLHERAVKNEPEISREINETAGQFHGTRIKPEFALKSEASLVSKLTRDSAEYLDTKRGQIDDAAANVSDALRYTLQFGDKNFADRVNQSLTDFQHEGFTALRVKNFFNNDPQNTYRGINGVFKDTTTNQLFEVQFHTPESASMVNQVHPLYQAMRDAPKNSDVYTSGNTRMAAMWSSVPNPPGVEAIGSTMVKKDAWTYYKLTAVDETPLAYFRRDGTNYQYYDGLMWSKSNVLADLLHEGDPWLDKLNGSPLTKGGAGSGQHAGHEFEGNQWTGYAQRMVQEHGGATLSPTGEEQKTGYIVATDPALGKVVNADDFFDPVKGHAILTDYLFEHQEDFAKNGKCLGLWHNSGKVHLDVVENIANRDEAVKAGRDRNQISIWDAAGAAEIPTDGSGSG